MDLPYWVMNSSKIVNKHLGVGSANWGDYKLSEQVANERARVKIARAVDTTVNSAVNDHMSA